MDTFSKGSFQIFVSVAMANQVPVEDRTDTAGQKDEDEPKEKSIHRNLNPVGYLFSFKS